MNQIQTPNRLWWRILLIFLSLIIFTIIIILYIHYNLPSSSLSDYIHYTLYNNDNIYENDRNNIYNILGGPSLLSSSSSSSSPSLSNETLKSLNLASHLHAIQAYAIDKGYNIDANGNLFFNEASCNAASSDTPPNLPAGYNSVSEMNIVYNSLLNTSGPDNPEVIKLGIALQQQLHYHFEWFDTSTGSVCVNTFPINYNLCSHYNFPYYPGNLECDKNGICNYIIPPTCYIPGSYCKSKGVQYDGSGFGDCYTNDLESIASSSIVGNTITREYNIRLQNLYNGCTSSVSDCATAYSMVATLPEEIVAKTVWSATKSFVSDFNQKCNKLGDPSIIKFIGCAQAITELNPSIWINDFATSFISAAVGITTELPQLGLTFWQTYKSHDPTYVATVIQYIVQFPGIQGLVEQFGSNIITAIQIGGTGVLDLLMTYKDLASLSFAAFGSDAINLFTFATTATGELASNTLQLFDLHAMLAINFVKGLADLTHIQFISSALQDVQIVNTAIINTLTTCINYVVITNPIVSGIKSLLQSAANGLACIFSDCSYQPLYQEWLFTPPPNSSVFPFQVVSLQQLIAQNRVNVLWPQASIDNLFKLI